LGQPVVPVFKGPGPIGCPETSAAKLPISAA